MVAQLEADIVKLKKIIDGIKQCIFCYQTQLAAPEFVAMCVRYYRLVSRWLVACAHPPPEGLPLPETVPRLFAALPEFCMSDVADFLKSVTHLAPQAFEQMASEELHDFVTMMVTFIGAPKYVKNPYLRATFTKLLRFLVPRSEDGDRRHVSDRLSVVLHTHPLAKKFLAPAAVGEFTKAPALVPLPWRSRKCRRFAYCSASTGTRASRKAAIANRSILFQARRRGQYQRRPTRLTRRTEMKGSSHGDVESTL